MTAGTGLVIYASRRLESMDNKRMAFLVVRTSAAAGLTMLVLRALHAAVVIPPSSLNQIAMVAASGVAAVAILTLALLALGHWWQVAGHMKQ